MDVNIIELQKNKFQNDTVFEMDMDERDQVSETLDYCMLEVLRWLEDERDPVLNILCNVFERIILPTYGIRYVQFLLLYTVSISQQCADRVLNNLWMIAAGLQGLGPGALSTRRTAASHLAGLLARCVRVPNSRLIHYLKTMAEWCHSYVTATQESTTSSDNVKAHGAFYAMCNALFYLIAFKNHHLFKSKESVMFVESLNLPRLVSCALNPLRWCPAQVAAAFASVARQHQVAYCQPVLERNARHCLLPSLALDAPDAPAPHHKDHWFPYDPYALPLSGKIIWPLCIEYKDWANIGADETQYNGMKRKLEADDDDYLMGSPCSKLASSLSNGVSAGFRTSDNIMM